MDLAFQMTQEQTQKLVMTTQMREALSILEMPTEELREYIMDRAEANVFVEFTRDGRTNFGRRTTSRTDGFSWIDTVEASWTLIDEIAHQLRVMDCRADERSYALRLVDDLDENGYLSHYDDALGLRLRLAREQWEIAVMCIQRCEPHGVGARNLRECLLLQLENVPRELRSLVEQLVANHLEDIAGGRFSQIGRRLKVPTEEVLTALDAIRQLNPRPGANFVGHNRNYVRPDLVVTQTDAGLAVLVTDALGDVSWQDASYRKLLGHEDVDVRHYLQRQWQEARWMRRCVVQRGLTLERIGKAMIELQPDFFLYGFRRLAPMRLRDVAEVLEVHESTISRAIRQKTIATPIGMFELRQLFSATLASSTGQVSAAAIQHQIREWIRSESGELPLTDAMISAQMQEEGIVVSRRTVAKYREAMGIPKSQARRIQVL